MNWWVFKANPRFYDLLGAVKAGANHFYRAKQGRSSMLKGDQVLFWIGSPNCCLVASGEIAGVPTSEPWPDDQKKFFRNTENFKDREFKVAITRMIIGKRTVSLNEMKADPELSEMEILYGGAPKTNFLVKSEHGKKMSNLLHS